MTTIPEALAALGIPALICLMFYARHREKVDYNGGKCRCGTPWRYFDTDSQGGRGYTCDTCGKGTWVSYWGIDR